MPCAYVHFCSVVFFCRWLSRYGKFTSGTDEQVNQFSGVVPRLFAHLPTHDHMLVFQILSAQVCNSAKTVCDSVAALNSASRAMIEVKNVGFLAASYTTTLDNCTYPIIPVAAQSLSLASNETAEVRFEVLCRILLPPLPH